ncbi:hypothetical protein HPP92_029159 [Vanilla planifolia]|uniref:Uncharacterized protein n=1 Tax=Vanilla planifolia TaxID=51239 RepID=A0A835P5C0_VANPL|nr:hypothetical protein HPP92_029159 [Vanilla planifolia]KAG0445816.1 hypothetical protein HPP92_029148 [Vanilla planifolia]
MTKSVELKGATEPKEAICIRDCKETATFHITKGTAPLLKPAQRASHNHGAPTTSSTPRLNTILAALHVLSIPSIHPRHPPKQRPEELTLYGQGVVNNDGQRCANGGASVSLQRVASVGALPMCLSLTSRNEEPQNA